MKYFDTHAHLTSEFFSQTEIKKCVMSAKAKGVTKIIVPSTNEKDAMEVMQIVDGKQSFGAVGIHPLDSQNISIKDFLSKIFLDKIVAIGEIGLDLHWEIHPSLKIQKKVFIQQLLFAKKHNLPILIHMRDCEEEMYKILNNKKFKNLKFVFHSFGSTWKWASQFLKLGAFISFSGIVTFKNAQEMQKVAKKVPLNKIMVETDTPYLTPVPHRGKQNLPEYVIYTAQFIANIRQESKEEVLEALFKNALKFFNL